MTPQLAPDLTMHDGGVGELDGGAIVAFPPAPTTFLPGARARLVAARPDALRRRLLLVADLGAAALALTLVLALAGRDRASLVLLVGLPLLVGLVKMGGLYDEDRIRLVTSTLDEAPRLVQLTGLYTLALTILQPVLVEHGLTGGEIAALWIASFAALLGGRIAARSAADRLAVVDRCIVIGELDTADRIRAKLASSRARAEVVATLPMHDGALTQLLSPHDVRDIVHGLRIDRIIIAPTSADGGCVLELIRVAKAAGVPVSVLPRMFEVVGSAAAFEDIDGLPVVGVPAFGLSRASHLLKRAFDLVATSIGMVLLAPVLAAIALAIRVDSMGPILFRQTRVGRDGRRFDIIKFRSMRADAEGQKGELLGLNEVGDGMFKISADPRVTVLGRFLRRTSLDELPQLFNVLRGEMSLVGPRPLVTDEDALVTGLDRSRLHLTPGMTGPWQVLGARVPMGDMLAIDYLYVSTWSLWADVKILLRTVRHVLRSANV